MSELSPAAVAGISLFSYLLMAVIALATAGLIAALVAGLARLEQRAASTEPVRPARPVAAPSIAPGIDPAVVAVIAAAVQSVAGGHRIVWIGETASAGGWTGEVRQRHHGSHQPRHDH
ncbi:MAG: hypothetical protein GX458_19365 [Phyllobacteriaceae bacterium]|nr:hypothetical protein [Phyllobacteriaceae bacterium]